MSSKKDDRKREEEGKETHADGEEEGDGEKNVPSLVPFKRDPEKERANEAEKVKLLALLKAIRKELSQPVKKGLKIRDYADIFVDRYNFFYDQAMTLFPESDFDEVFERLTKTTTSLEKISLEITLLIAYVENDIMDIIEQSERLRQKNKWLQDRLREFEIKIAGIQAIK